MGNKIDDVRAAVHVDVDLSIFHDDIIKIWADQIPIRWDPVRKCFLEFDSVFLKLRLQRHNAMTAKSQATRFSCFPCHFQHNKSPIYAIYERNKGRPTDLFGEWPPQTGDRLCALYT